MPTLRLLAVIALAFVVGCSSQTENKPLVVTPIKTVNADVTVTKEIALKVPNMQCPHGCWPTVQETLAAEKGVGTLKLADQKNDSLIDNPVVYVGVDDEFSADHAIAALAEHGFADSKVQN